MNNDDLNDPLNDDFDKEVELNIADLEGPLLDTLKENGEDPENVYAEIIQPFGLPPEILEEVEDEERAQEILADILAYRTEDDPDEQARMARDIVEKIENA